MKGPKAAAGAKKKEDTVAMKKVGKKIVKTKTKGGLNKTIETGVKLLKKSNVSDLAETISMSDAVMESLNGQKKPNKNKLSPQVKMGLKIDALIKKKVDSGDMPSLPTSPSSPENAKARKKRLSRKKSLKGEDIQSSLENESSPDQAKKNKKRKSRKKSNGLQLAEEAKGETSAPQLSSENSVSKKKRPRRKSMSSDNVVELENSFSAPESSPEASKIKKRRPRKKSKSLASTDNSVLSTSTAESSAGPKLGDQSMNMDTKGKKSRKRKKSHAPRSAQELENSPLSTGAPAGSRKRNAPKPQTSDCSPPKKMAPSSSPFQLDPEQVSKAVSSLMSHLNSKKSTSVLNESEPIFVQLGFNGVPLTPKHFFRLKLKHPLTLDTTDVCLFVKDEKKDSDETVLHFTDLLSKNGIKVSEIIPFKALKSEYGQYEEKRKLSERFDIFLCDSRINVTSILGKKFHEKSKVPTNVDLANENKIKVSFDAAIRKSLLVLNSTGSESSVQAGWSSMQEEKICDNIISLVNDVQSVIPNIIPLIKKVAIKAQKSPSFELYVNLCPPPVSKQVISAGVKAKPVEGELSTKIDQKVIVYPTGEVIVKDPSGKSPSSAKKRNRTRKRKSVKRLGALSTSEEDGSPKKSAAKGGEMLATPLNGAENTNPASIKKTNPAPQVKSPKKKVKSPKQKKGGKQPQVTPSKDEGTINPLVWRKGDPSPNVKKLQKKSALTVKDQKENAMVWKKENTVPKAKNVSPKMKKKTKAKKVN